MLRNWLLAFYLDFLKKKKENAIPLSKTRGMNKQDILISVLMFLLQASWCTKMKVFPHNSIISIHSICTESPEKYMSLSTLGKSAILSTVRSGLGE